MIVRTLSAILFSLVLWTICLISFGLFNTNSYEKHIVDLHQTQNEEIAELLTGYYKQVEKETTLLKQVNSLQRETENLEAQLQETKVQVKTLQLEADEYKEEIELMEVKLAKRSKGSKNHPKPPTPEEEAVKEAKAKAAAKAHTLIEEHEQKEGEPREQAHRVNTPTRESAPIGIPVLLLTQSNGKRLDGTLQSILKYAPTAGFPVFVSQDGNSSDVAAVIRNYPQVYQFRFTYKPNNTTLPRWKPYYQTSKHYHFALTQLFDSLGYEKVIIVGDDMQIAPDFFSYFERMGPLLDEDASLMCVSAWNEQGQARFVWDPVAVYRSNSLPGLGFMLNKELWEEVSPKWPQGFWDDWLREPEQRQGRSCAYPEISRVSFTDTADNNTQFVDKFLRKIKLNEHSVDFSEFDLSYLIKGRYDQYFGELLDNATKTSFSRLPKLVVNLTQTQEERGILIVYDNATHRDAIIDQVGLMKRGKERDIIPGEYMGVLMYRSGATRVFLAPSG